MNVSVQQGSSFCLETGVRKSLVKNINYSLTHRGSVGGIAVQLQMLRRYSCETGQIMESSQNTSGTNLSAAQLYPREDELKN